MGGAVTGPMLWDAPQAPQDAPTPADVAWPAEVPPDAQEAYRWHAQRWPEGVGHAHSVAVAESLQIGIGRAAWAVSWLRSRGLLVAAGQDERGRDVYRRADVARVAGLVGDPLPW